MEDKHYGCLLAYGMMLPQKPIKWLGKFLVEKACWILLQYVHNVEDFVLLSVFTTIYITRGHSRTLHVPTPTRAAFSLPRQALGKNPLLRTRFTIIITPIKNFGSPLELRPRSPTPFYSTKLAVSSLRPFGLRLMSMHPYFSYVLTPSGPASSLGELFHTKERAR